METQQDNSIIFSKEEYGDRLRKIAVALEHYLDSRGIAVDYKLFEPNTPGQKITYHLDNMVIISTSNIDSGSLALTSLEVEVLSDDEKITSQLLRKLKSVALPQ